MLGHRTNRAARRSYPARTVRALTAIGAAAAVAALVTTAATTLAPASAATSTPPATAATSTPPATGASGHLLDPQVGLYPRLIRLQHSGAANGTIVASDVTFDGPNGANGVGAIWASHDDGRTFARIGSVRDPEAAAGKGLCCATLYELPQRVGSLRAGTLLWSASIGQSVTPDRRMTIRVWASKDHGRHWCLLATPATAPNDLGLWEPEFTVARNGALVVFFSDETDQPAHSQRLDEAVSWDGVHWSFWRPVVQSSDPAARPGMANVRRIAGGTYLMTYEVCGATYDCRVHYRQSPDGVHWGDPAALGPVVTAADGSYFEHTPTIVWSPDGGRAGRLYLVGQLYQNPDGTTAPGNGDTVLVSNHGPAGPWRAINAPVAVPDAYDNYCPNYSSPLLPIDHGRRLLEIATAYASDGVCEAYYGTGRS